MLRKKMLGTAVCSAAALVGRSRTSPGSPRPALEGWKAWSPRAWAEGNGGQHWGAGGRGRGGAGLSNFGSEGQDSRGEDEGGQGHRRLVVHAKQLACPGGGVDGVE